MAAVDAWEVITTRLAGLFGTLFDRCYNLFYRSSVE